MTGEVNLGQFLARMGRSRTPAEARIRAACYLTILNRELPPGELVRLVGMQPDEMWRKGDPKPGKARVGVRGSSKRPNNGVTYESGLGELASPRDHFAALMERLRPFAAGIAAVADLPSTHGVTIWIVEHSETWNSDMLAEPEHLEIVAAMHAKLVFSSYFYDQAEND
jgi:Domain of unknown function (DUF4279)